MLQARGFGSYRNGTQMLPLIDWAKGLLSTDTREDLVQIVKLDGFGRPDYTLAEVERIDGEVKVLQLASDALVARAEG